MRHDHGSFQGKKGGPSDAGAELTPTQQEVLDYIVRYAEEHEVIPDVSTILHETGKKSRSNLYRILRELARQGYLEMGSSESGTRLIYKLTKLARLRGEKAWPLLGIIPAGPIQNIDTMHHDVISSISDIIPDMKNTDRVIRVTGDWMREQGIMPGDFVVISVGQDYLPRDICALRRNGSSEILLAHVTSLRSSVQLGFANEHYASRNLPKEDVVVLGVVTAHISLTSFFL